MDARERECKELQVRRLMVGKEPATFVQTAGKQKSDLLASTEEIVQPGLRNTATELPNSAQPAGRFDPEK